MSDLPPANWYPDPEVPGQQRYWDGTQWTEHRAPGQGAGAAGDQDVAGSQGTAGQAPPGEPAGVAQPYAQQPQYQQPYGQQPQGQPYAQQSYGQQSSPPTSGMAIASLVLAIIWLGGVGSLAAVVLGILAIRKINDARGRQGGKGLAIAGTVIGGIGIVGSILFYLLLFSVASGGEQFFQDVVDYAECVEEAERTGADPNDC